MATFLEQFTAYFGEGASGDVAITNDMLSTWLTDGAKDIINKLPVYLLEDVASANNVVDNSGYSITNTRVLNVERTNGSQYYPCRQIHPRLAGRAANSSDMIYAMDSDPCYYRTTNKIYILPVPTATKIAKVYEVDYPAVLYSASDISAFPNNLESLVVIYAVIQGKLREIGTLRRKVFDEIESITNNGYLSNFENALSVMVLPESPSIGTLTLESMTELPTLVLSDATDSFPEFDKTLSLPTLVLSNKTDLPDLTLTDAQDFSNLDLSGITVPSNILAYVSAGDEPTDTLSSRDLPEFNLPISSLDMSSFTSHMTNEDIELAQTELQKQAAYINEYQADIQREIGSFNSEMSAYQGYLQNQVATAQTDVNAYTAKMQDNRNGLEEQIAQYQSDINVYQAAVNAAVQEWLAEEVQFKLQKWQTQVSSEIQEYQVLAQSLTGEYQVVTSAEIQDYSAKVSTAINEYQSEISLYGAKVQAYLGELNALRNSEIQEYSAKVQAYIQEYSTKNNVLIAEYSNKSQIEIQKYTALVQSYAAEYNNHLARAKSYLEESTIRLQTSAQYLQLIPTLELDLKTLQEKYNNDLKNYIGVTNG